MMKQVRMTFIGVSGSGKTNAIGSIWKQFSTQAPHNFHLYVGGSERSARARLAGDLDRYADIDENFVSSGTATGKKIPVCFRGTFAPDLPTEPLFALDLYDYPGRWLEEITGSGSSNSAKLLDRIAFSDILMLFADANVLTDPNLSIAQITKRTASNINTIFNTLATDADDTFFNRPRTVQILLTKCDSELIPEEFRKDRFIGLINRALEVFQPVVNFCRNCSNAWNFAVIPTSTCGNGHSHTYRTEDGVVVSKMTAAPEPYGFDLAVLYGICRELEYRMREKSDLCAGMPETIASGKNMVSSWKWNYIIKRTGLLSRSRSALYAQYIAQLKQVIDPMCRLRRIAEF